jgi:YVTN family beta-propeller protein
MPALALLAALAVSQDLTSTGRALSPAGQAVETGGLPVNLAVSPDGKWVAATHGGTQQDLVILSARTGKVVGRVSFEKDRPGGKGKDSLYFGLTWAKSPEGQTLLYSAHGASDRVDAYAVSQKGELSGPVQTFSSPRPMIADLMPHFLAGVAVSSDGKRVFAAGNQSFALSNFKGTLNVFDYGTTKVRKTVPLPAFPLDAALVTQGPSKDKKLYVSCEGAASVAVVDTETLKVVREIPVGLNPTHMVFDSRQKHLFVSCASSDTVSVIDTESDTVAHTVLVRPAELRGMPGVNPLGLSVSPDDKTLYVALSDLNAVAVVDLRSLTLKGMVPSGWYPTDVVPVKSGLMVAWGKGDRVVNPNLPGASQTRRQVIDGDSGPPIRKHLVGKVARLKWPVTRPELARMTRKVLRNNALPRLEARLHKRPEIDHVVYIVKENRTYDQFFGDFKQGNGEPSLHLYDDRYVPNQRALARRFGLWDNFYACAEMSADGWSWATAGIASEYVQRNAQYEYSGHKREYDYEGQVNGTPADAKGMRNVNTPPGGYLWDNAVKNGVSFINYGMYFSEGVPFKTPNGQPIADDNGITMKAFEGRADLSYREYDLSFADSDMWEKLGRTFPARRADYAGAKSRFQRWQSEYRRLTQEGKVPSLMFVRFGNDHTNGTTPGFPTPESCIADNDYAVGQLVEEISHGPLWKRTAIVIVEDDAQGGYDHVDGHRSICFVVSPWCKKGGVYKGFANTDTAVRTVEWLLKMPPTNQFTATANVLDCFGSSPVNAEPFTAVLPDNAVIALNDAHSYRAADSMALFNPMREESVPDLELADILWGSMKGAAAPRPQPRRLSP